MSPPVSALVENWQIFFSLCVISFSRLYISSSILCFVRENHWNSHIVSSLTFLFTYFAAGKKIPDVIFFILGLHNFEQGDLSELFPFLSLFQFISLSLSSLFNRKQIILDWISLDTGFSFRVSWSRMRRYGWPFDCFAGVRKEEQRVLYNNKLIHHLTSFLSTTKKYRQ